MATSAYSSLTVSKDQEQIKILGTQDFLAVYTPLEWLYY